ncbi:unnamed protein product [Amoebophrya sp. A25]|nr:unnamed protein product [Amoebophrya sp. A25]|eukprot:GSA25T00007856001.1
MRLDHVDSVVANSFVHGRGRRDVELGTYGNEVLSTSSNIYSPSVSNDGYTTNGEYATAGVPSSRSPRLHYRRSGTRRTELGATPLGTTLHSTSFLGYGLAVALKVPRLYAAIMRGAKKVLCSGGGEYVKCTLNKFGTEVEKCEGWCGIMGLMWFKTRYRSRCQFHDAITYPWSAHRGPTYGNDPVYRQVRRQVCCSHQCWDIDDWRLTLASLSSGCAGTTPEISAGVALISSCGLSSFLQIIPTTTTTTHDQDHDKATPRHRQATILVSQEDAEDEVEQEDDVHQIQNHRVRQHAQNFI